MKFPRFMRHVGPPKPRLAAALLIAATIPSHTATAQQALSHAEIAPGIFLIRGAVGNITVLTGPDGILLVDTGVEERAGDVLKELRMISAAPVRYIVNTHWHYDHRGGNSLVGQNATIISHEQTRQLLATRRFQFGNEYPPLSGAALPSLTYSDRINLHFDGENVRIWNLPGGHTGGDSIVYFERANVLATGDLFFMGRLPMIDLPSGGSIVGYVRNVGELIAQMPDDVKIVGGHGELATLDDFRRYHAMLKGALDIVSTGIEKGQSLEQMRIARVLDQYDGWRWKNDFITPDRLIVIIYSSLTGQQVEIFPEEK